MAGDNNDPNNTSGATYNQVAGYDSNGNPYNAQGVRLNPNSPLTHSAANPFGLSQAAINAYAASGADPEAIKAMQYSLDNGLNGTAGAQVEQYVNALKTWSSGNQAAITAHQQYLNLASNQPGQKQTILTPMSNTSGTQSTILGQGTTGTVLGGPAFGGLTARR